MVFELSVSQWGFSRALNGTALALTDEERSENGPARN